MKHISDIDIAVRKLALRMVSELGVLKTCMVTNISRSTLWRWKRFGVNRKRLEFVSKLFETNKNMLKSFLLSTKCTTARGVVAFFKSTHNLRLSTKTVYRFIKLLGFTRKRSKLSGQCKGDLGAFRGFIIRRFSLDLRTATTVRDVTLRPWTTIMRPPRASRPHEQSRSST